MIARRTLLTVTGLLMGGFATAHAAAADYGISFRYSSYTPPLCGPQYYSSYYPRSYAYYDDYCEPVVYIGSTTPRTIVYDGYYPRAYRTTYTRSDCYARPMHRARASVHYRSSASRTRHHSRYATYRHKYRRTPSYRHSYTSSRYSPRIHTRLYRDSRCRDLRRSSPRRHYRAPRVRIYRR